MQKTIVAELREAFTSANLAGRQKRYSGMKQIVARPVCRHDVMQRILVEWLQTSYPSAVVDFEVNVGGRWIDVLMVLDGAAYIFELKSKNEHWSAGEVVRQLGLYARSYAANDPICILVHEGPLFGDEQWLLTKKSIVRVECTLPDAIG